MECERPRASSRRAVQRVGRADRGVEHLPVLPAGARFVRRRFAPSVRRADRGRVRPDTGSVDRAPEGPATMARIAAPPAQRDHDARLRPGALPMASLAGLIALILLGASAASLRAAPMHVIDVRYTGASHITTDSVLRATASAQGARIAAVTFYFDGR